MNVKKTKEVIIDFRRKPTEMAPMLIHGSEVEIVESFKFLGTTISNDLKWSINVDIIVKKAQQRLFFLRLLRRFRVSQELLVEFYRAVVECVLTLFITAWYGNTTAVDRRRLNRVVKTATKITRAKLPTFDHVY